MPRARRQGMPLPGAVGLTDRPDELRELTGAIASALGRTVRLAGNRLERLVDRDPYHVAPYRGYGTARRVLVQGRVLEDEGLQPADPARSDWRNLLDALRRLESDPLPHARLRAHAGGAAHELVADDEGFFRQWIDLPETLAPGTAGWHPVSLDLVSTPSPTPNVSAPVLVPPSDAAFGVVSDLDDTVLQSEVRHFLRAARLVLLENARTRLPFPGVAAFYRALHAGSSNASTEGHGNPLFYVSSSPWNLYDVISDFLGHQGIPAGPLLLRDWDLGPALLRTRAHKEQLMVELFETYAALPFILVGDSAQEDPEIYAAMVERFPGRVLAVYIRNVHPHPERSAAIQTLADRVLKAGSSLVLADDTLAAARHAAEHGWIADGALPEIGGEKRDDTTGPAKVDAPGVDPDAAGPTLVVEET